MSEKLVEFCGEIRHETQPGVPDEGAYYIWDGKDEVCLPKSLIRSARCIKGEIGRAHV